MHAICRSTFYELLLLNLKYPWMIGRWNINVPIRITITHANHFKHITAPLRAYLIEWRIQFQAPQTPTMFRSRIISRCPSQITLSTQIIALIMNFPFHFRDSLAVFLLYFLLELIQLNWTLFNVHKLNCSIPTSKCIEYAKLIYGNNGNEMPNCLPNNKKQNKI